MLMYKHRNMNINDLAFFDGTPRFSEKLHVGRPNIGRKDHLFRRFDDMLKRKRLTNDGPFVKELEQKLADFLGVKHCVATNNATIALEITARALGLQEEVIIPSFTFVATAHALRWQGIIPVFCDIDPYTHNIDVEKAEKLITSRTTGILGVHVWGRACDIEALDALAHKHTLSLVFDAAHAFACSYQGKMIGCFGKAEVFSFHATKFFNAFEGGAITTNDDVLAKKFRQMRNFGFTDFDRVDGLGINGKMSEASAAMGLTSFESLNDFLKINYRNYLLYSEYLQDIRGVKIIHFDEQEKNNYQYVVVEIDESISGISRDLIMQILHAENVFVRRYFYPGVHQMAPYFMGAHEESKKLKETEKLTLKVLQLPTGTAITKTDIVSICQIIHFIVVNATEIRKRIG